MKILFTLLLQTNEDISIHAYYETSSMITAFLLYPVDVLAKVYLLNIPLLERGVGHETDIIISSLEFRTQVSEMITNCTGFFAAGLVGAYSFYQEFRSSLTLSLSNHYLLTRKTHQM